MVDLLTRSPTRRLEIDDQQSLRQAVTSAAVRKGMVTNAAFKFSAQFVQLGVQVVLARVLTPADYGLTAIVTVVAAFAGVFTELGLGAAVVHRAQLTGDYVASAFWLNVLSGLALTALFAGLAYPIAWIYDEPRLVPLMLVTSLSFTLSSCAVHIGLMERRFQYLQVAMVEFVAVVVSSVIGVVLAVLGFGPISLTIMFVTLGATRTILSWSSLGGIPTGRTNRADVGAIFTYTRGLIGFATINYFSANFDNLVLGRTQSAGQFGLYVRAYNLMLLPIGQVQQILGRVLFPALASVQDDPARLRRAFEKTLVMMTAVGAPVALGVAASADSLITTLYGPRWADAGPILRVLALCGVPMIIGGALSLGLQALGLTGTQFRRGLVTATGVVIAVVIGVRWGSMGVAIAIVVRTYVTLPLNYLPCRRAMGLSTSTIARQCGPVVLAAAGAAAATLLVGRNSTGWVVLLTQVATMGVLYPVLLRLFAHRVYRELVGVVSRRNAPASRGRHSVGSAPRPRPTTSAGPRRPRPGPGQHATKRAPSRTKEGETR
jgi:O-antigen/teichoic acid export membrane protein